MNRRALFHIVKKDYGNYINYCTSRFYEQKHYLLDAIYDADDVEQLIYIQIWKYIGRFNTEKSSLKSYIIMIMHQVFSTCIVLSNMQKRCNKGVVSMNAKIFNQEGGYIELGDTLPDNSSPNIDNNLNEYFYTQILKETEKRIYMLVKGGYSYKKIGNIFNVSKQSIHHVLLKIGKKIRRHEREL